jgi:hypothetical protein
MQHLPMEIGKEIFSFLLPNSRYITFRMYLTNGYSRSSYHPRYEKAFIGDEKVKNKRGFYLSKIWKKNGKHRYYITKEIVDMIDIEYNDREKTIYHYDYASYYVGRNIDMALLELYYC